MKTGLSVFLILFFLSCEKNYEPLGGGEVYLETDKDIYTTDDSIHTYLVNNSNRSVFSFWPNEWQLYKKIDEDWKLIFPTSWIAVPSVPHEWKNPRMLVFKRAFQDTGLFKIQMPLSWDKEYKEIEDLGLVYSNTFIIKIGT